MKLFLHIRKEFKIAAVCRRYWWLTFHAQRLAVIDQFHTRSTVFSLMTVSSRRSISIFTPPAIPS